VTFCLGQLAGSLFSRSTFDDAQITSQQRFSLDILTRSGALSIAHSLIDSHYSTQRHPTNLKQNKKPDLPTTNTLKKKRRKMFQHKREFTHSISLSPDTTNFRTHEIFFFFHKILKKKHTAPDLPTSSSCYSREKKRREEKNENYNKNKHWVSFRMEIPSYTRQEGIQNLPLRGHPFFFLSFRATFKDHFLLFLFIDSTRIFLHFLFSFSSVD
jgi:hypothetical protein